MPKEPLYTKFSASGGRINVKHVYDTDIEYWGYYAIVFLIFIISFTVSGIIWYRTGAIFECLEISVIPYVFVSIMWTTIDNRPKFFTPTFVLGCIWGFLSLLIDGLRLDIASFVFFYCFSIILVFLVETVKHR